MADPAENLTQTQDVAVKPQLVGDAAIVKDESEFALLLDSAKFNQAWRAATLFSKSKLVPATFQGSPESCFVAMHMAVRLNLDPMMVMQKTYIVHGRPGMEAQLVIALVNARGPFKGPIQWDKGGEGDNRYWTAWAIHRETGIRCEATVDWEMVEAEGWNKDKQIRDGGGVQKSKWNTMPDVMGHYRSAVFLARRYCPEVIMGLSTVDELQDLPDEVIEAEALPVPTEPKPTQTEKIKEKLKRTRKTSEKPKVDTPAPDKGNGQGEPEPPTEVASEGQGPDIDELLKTLEGKGWPLAKLLIKFGSKPKAEWGEREKQMLADMAASE